MTSRRCWLEAEVGRMEISVLGEFAAGLGPKEMVVSPRMEELETTFVTNSGGSYRVALETLNRVLHRDGSTEIKLRTLHDRINRYGSAISEHIDAEVRDILESFGLDPDSGIQTDPTILAARVAAVSETDGARQLEKYCALVRDFNEGKPERLKIKMERLGELEIDPSHAVCIPVDEVCTNHQADHRRTKNGGKHIKDGVYVENTVIPVVIGGTRYIITDPDMKKACLKALAFLLKGGYLDGRPLVFFSDGATNIYSSIQELFSFYPYKLYLDWYHLKKRIRELMSMAIKASKEERHAQLAEINSLLWVGGVQEAIDFINAIDKKYVKDEKNLRKVVAYLERKQMYIYCYALRAVAGLVNSSNIGEKSNDLVVAQRQKDNGMSWSYRGSSCLALLTAVRRNGELQDWIMHRKLRFTLRDAA